MVAGRTGSGVHVRELKDVERRFLYLSISIFVMSLFIFLNFAIYQFAVSSGSIDFDGALVEYVTCAMLNQKTNCDKVSALQRLLYASITSRRVAILTSLLLITYYLSFDRNVRAVWNKWCCRCGAGSTTPATSSGTPQKSNTSETTKL